MSDSDEDRWFGFLASFSGDSMKGSNESRRGVRYKWDTIYVWHPRWAPGRVGQGPCTVDMRYATMAMLVRWSALVVRCYASMAVRFAMSECGGRNWRKLGFRRSTLIRNIVLGSLWEDWMRFGKMNLENSSRNFGKGERNLIKKSFGNLDNNFVRIWKL